MVSAIESSRVESKRSEPAAQNKTTAEKSTDAASAGLFALLMAHLQSIAEGVVEQGTAASSGDASEDSSGGDVAELLLQGADKAPAEPAAALLAMPQAEALAAAALAGETADAAQGPPTEDVAAVAVMDLGEAEDSQGPVQAPAQAPASSAKYVVTPPVAEPEPAAEQAEATPPEKGVQVSDADLIDVPEPLAAPAKPVAESRGKGLADEPAAPVAKPAVSAADLEQAQSEANDGDESEGARSAFRETKPLAASELLKQAVGNAGRGEPADRPLRVNADDVSPASTHRVDVSTQAQAPVDAAETRGVGAAQKADDTSAFDRTTLGRLHEVTARGVKYLIREGGETITVRLVPESLGEVRFDVTRAQDSVSVRLVSANPAVRSVLESQVPGLRDQLTQDGFTVSQIVVTSDAASPNSQGGHFGNAWPDQTPAWRGAHSASSLNATHPQSYEAPPRRGAVHHGALDVFA